MRVKNRRNLFRAVPVAVKMPSGYLNLKEQGRIDRGWREFWRKRGHKEPPKVSAYVLGSFDLPPPKNIATR